MTIKIYYRFFISNSNIIVLGYSLSHMICRTRKWRDNPTRCEYTCNGYHRYGKNQCTPRTVGEAILDKLINEEMLEIKKMAHENFKNIDKNIRKWMANKPTAEKRIENSNYQLSQRKSDQQQILLERIRDKEHAEIYTEMLKSCEEDIKKLSEQIKEFDDVEATIKNRKKQMKSSLELIDNIVAEGAISDTHLRMLIDVITVTEINGELKISITLNGEFRSHFDTYDELGEITERYSEIWWFPDDVK